MAWTPNTKFPTYPAHPDFDYSREVMALSIQRKKDWGRKPWVAFAASESWKDQDHLESFIDKLSDKYTGTKLIVPHTRGAMKDVVQRAQDQAFEVYVVRSEGQFGNHRQAVQAGHVVRLSDIVVCFWAGGSDIVKAVIDKALLLHRPEPQFVPGLHVYEQTKTRATRSKKAALTGKVRYRTSDPKAPHLLTTDT